MHKIHTQLLTRPVNVTVVGAGGTGSQMLTGLAQLHTAMYALGHPGGLSVSVIDDDHVSEANVGRQMFFPSDIGLSKAHVMVNRINATFGTAWSATTARVTEDTSMRNCDLVIGCVDNRAARKAIFASLKRSVAYRSKAYWLDIGNRLSDGQAILGEIHPESTPYDPDRLPHAIDLFPEIADASLELEDDTPSCSLAEALEKQSLFINRAVSLSALNILWELFRYGEISYHGSFVNLRSGRTTPLAVDPETWARFGYKAKKPRQRKPKAK